MFDLNFYTKEGIRRFKEAGQKGIDQNTPPTRCEELYEQEMFRRILSTMNAVNGDILPISVGFADDLKDHVDLLIFWFLAVEQAGEWKIDLRQKYGFEID